MELDFLGSIVAAFGTFLVGGLWYSPKVFGGICKKECGEGRETPEGKHPRYVFVGAYLLSVVGALGLSYLLGPKPSIERALTLSAEVGLLFVATCFGINYLFSGRSLKLWLIDSGYHLLQFLIFGAVLAFI